MARGDDAAETGTGRALARMLMNDTSGALEDLESVLARRPDHGMALEQRSLLRALTGDATACLDDARRAAEIDPRFEPSKPDPAVSRALLAPATGAPLPFVFLADRARSPMVEAYLARARLRAKGGDVDGAVFDCETAARIDPRSPDPLVAKAAVHLEQGDLQGALTSSREALRLNPRHALALATSGLAQVLSGKLQPAQDDLTKALRLDDANVTAHFALGLLELKGREFAAAQKHLDRAAELDPGHGDARNAQAYVAALRGSPSKAVRLLDEILAAEPRNADALDHRSLLKALLEDQAGSLADLKRAVALDPRAGTYGGPWTLSASLTGEPQAALTSDAVTIQPEPLYGRAYDKRGYWRGESSDHAGALCDFSVAVRLDPANCVTRYNLGLAHEILDKPKEAIPHYRLAIVLDDTYTNAHCGLVRVLVAVGEAEQAAEAAAALCHINKNPALLSLLAREILPPTDSLPSPRSRAGTLLAERAVALTDRRQPHILSTLAATYFADGSPIKALRVQEEVIALMDGKDADDYPLDLALRELELYRKATK
jgi:tetratricopeptide (TPR) repeat protein